MKLDRSVTQDNVTTERKVLPAGVYKFKVEGCVRKMSKAGVPMWELQLSFPEEPDARWVYDYLTESEKMMWKFNQFFDCIGSIATDTEEMKYMFGESGQVRLTVEQSEQYGDRNKVQRYLPLQKAPAAPKPAKLVKDDELPF